MADVVIGELSKMAMWLTSIQQIPGVSNAVGSRARVHGMGSRDSASTLEFFLVSRYSIV